MSKKYPWYRAGIKQNPWEATLSIKEMGIITLMKNIYWETDTLPDLPSISAIYNIDLEELTAAFTPRVKILWEMALKDLKEQIQGNDKSRSEKAEKMAIWRGKGKPRTEDGEAEFSDTPYRFNTSASVSLD